MDDAVAVPGDVDDPVVVQGDVADLFERRWRYPLFWDRVRTAASSSAAAAALYAVYLDDRTAEVVRLDASV